MIYLIHGADSFRAREKLNELISEFKKKRQNAANLDIFDADSLEKDFNAGKVKAAGQTLGFLSPARMIVVKNLFSEKGAEAKKEIADFVIEMDKKKREVDFVFFEKLEIGKKGSAGGKEWSALAKNGTVLLFNPLSLAEARKWVLAKLKKEEIKITPGALDKLILYGGDDLWRLSSEIEKLALLKLGGKARDNTERQAVDEEDIEAMVKSDFSTSIFTTMDALARRDKKTALKLLAGHLEKGEAPIYLFSMFAYQISNLIKVKDIIVRESLSGKSASAEEISRALKMHPFVVKKIMPYAAKFTLEYLKKVYKRMLRLDFSIKKGRLDAEAALEMIVIEVGNLA